MGRASILADYLFLILSLFSLWTGSVKLFFVLFSLLLKLCEGCSLVAPQFKPKQGSNGHHDYTVEKMEGDQPSDSVANVDFGYRVWDEV